MHLTKNQIIKLQTAYSGLIDRDSDDPLEPIDPRTFTSLDGDRLIHIAALRGDLQTIDVLLKAGEDVNAIGDMGNTPAHYAAAGKWRILFDFLMESGADPTIENDFGVTALLCNCKPVRPHDRLLERTSRRNERSRR